MNSNVRRGMRSLGELMQDWMDNTEQASNKRGETLPEPTQKGFAEMRKKIRHPPRAA